MLAPALDGCGRVFVMFGYPVALYSYFGVVPDFPIEFAHGHGLGFRFVIEHDIYIYYTGHEASANPTLGQQSYHLIAQKPTTQPCIPTINY